MPVTHQPADFDVRQWVAFCAAPDLKGGGFYAKGFGGFSFVAKRVIVCLGKHGHPLHFPDNTKCVSFGSVKKFPFTASFRPHTLTKRFAPLSRGLKWCWPVFENAFYSGRVKRVF